MGGFPAKIDQSLVFPLCFCLALTDGHAQQYELSVMAKTKKMVQVLLDFIVNWREFYDHSFFRDLTSNQRRLEK